MRLEHRMRSVAKATSWRALAALDTIVLSYIFTGSVSAALSIAGLELLTKVVWYYFHERAWQRFQSSISRFSKAHWFAPMSRAQSLAKTITWRFLGSLDTAVIALIITKVPTTSAAIGGTELITKVILYYLHERAWLKVRWGARILPDSDGTMGSKKPQSGVSPRAS